MTRTFNKQRIENLVDEDSGAILSDMNFARCKFQNCTLSRAHSPTTRTRVERVSIHNSAVKSCRVFSPELSQVIFDRVRTGSEPLFTRGAVFDRVTLAGQLDRIVIIPDPGGA